MAKNGHLIVILYECDCTVDKKLRHHPDYFKIYEIEMLCPKCHIRKHAELKKLGKDPADIFLKTLKQHKDLLPYSVVD